MYYLPRDASAARMKEAENARQNRAEIVKALSTGEATRRDMLKWGIFTTAGGLAMINGLNPLAPTKAYAADIPTGVPPSPLFGVRPFTQPLKRLQEQPRQELTAVTNVVSGEAEVRWPTGTEQLNGRRLSYHTSFTNSGGATMVNPRTGVGPIEGRPPGEFFAHQRWEEFLPKVGYVMTMGPLADGIGFHPNMPAQDPNSVWTFGMGRNGRSTLPPPLIKLRYGEPVLFRHYNQLPLDEHDNNGFGSNNQATHNHNAHNASASDGASNAHFFPGQFYDYHWSTTLARNDMINTDASDRRASGPDGNGGLVQVKGDFRELQSSLWFHDHRFFLTAENVYKGHAGMLNYYSGPDRGNEELRDGVNLRLPSGKLLDWGNTDFDVNLFFHDYATDQQGQYFFDIFNTDGFLGDLVAVNFAYKPFMEVLPRKYRFRMLAAGMSRFWKFSIVNQNGRPMPVTVIANDGNLLTQPITRRALDIQGTGERFDIIVDFSDMRIGDRLYIVNNLEHDDGRGPEGTIGIRRAFRGRSEDPAVGAAMEFRIVNSVESVDVPGVTHRATDRDRSRIPRRLTQQIPIVSPVRERHFEWKRGGGDSLNDNGECFPSCEGKESFPWTVRVNGENSHSLNANRISAIIPEPGQIEHWTIENGGGGWDHPIHLHFEEGITMNRGGDRIPNTERLARKDVWRLREGGKVQFQIQFGEYGGAYVQHCHNTVHEDFAMLMRLDILTDPNNPNSSQRHTAVIPTPDPRPEGVTYRTPEILPEGNPFHPDFDPFPRRG